MNYRDPESYWEKRCKLTEDLIDQIVYVLTDTLPPEEAAKLTEIYNKNYKEVQDL